MDPKLIQMGISAGTNAANTAVGMGLGRLMEKHNDKRQIKQQTALQNLQIQGNKEMVDYGKAADLQMWKDTNYSAQMGEIEKAGLNPAMLYGMSGGGGVTTGGGGSGVSGGQAPQGGGEAQGMGLGMLQAQNMSAQTANINADTEKKRMETLKAQQEKEKLEYENLVNDYLQNHDKDGNMIEGEGNDKNRMVIQQKIQELGLTTEQVAKVAADVKQGWTDLDIKGKQQALNEKMGAAELENKDQDQIIKVIDMILGVVTKGLIGGRHKK